MKLVVLTITLLIVATWAQELPDHCNYFSACSAIVGPCQSQDADCGMDRFCCVNHNCHSHCEHVHGATDPPADTTAANMDTTAGNMDTTAANMDTTAANMDTSPVGSTMAPAEATMPDSSPAA